MPPRISVKSTKVVNHFSSIRFLHASIQQKIAKFSGWFHVGSPHLNQMNRKKSDCVWWFLVGWGRSNHFSFPLVGFIFRGKYKRFKVMRSQWKISQQRLTMIFKCNWGIPRIYPELVSMRVDTYWKSWFHVIRGRKTTDYLCWHLVHFDFIQISQNLVRMQCRLVSRIVGTLAINSYTADLKKMAALEWNLNKHPIFNLILGHFLTKQVN